ncbi:MAG: TetR/AcrR family transcriptional regulator [Myxococcota bacterium]
MSRERILEGAGIILDSGKYGHLTVDALARSLHMSKSTLYKYFASKEDVVVALVEESCAAAEVELARALASGTAAEQLTKLAEIIGRHGERLPRAVLVEPERLPAICSERLAVTRAHFADAAHQIVTQGVANKSFAHPAPDIVAVAFVAAALAMLAKAAQSDKPEYEVTLGYLPELYLPALQA